MAAIGAEQELAFRRDGIDPRFHKAFLAGLLRFLPEAPVDDVPVRMVHRLEFGDVSVVLQITHQGVVMGDLTQPVRTIDINPGVTDVRDMGHFRVQVHQGGRHDTRHLGKSRLQVLFRTDGVVRLHQRPFHQLQGLVGPMPLHIVQKGTGRDRRGDLAALVPANTVDSGQQEPRSAIDGRRHVGVLIVLPDPTRIRSSDKSVCVHYSSELG